MRKPGIRGVIRGKSYKTTVADLGAERPADLAERSFTATAPNRLWVADITFVATWRGPVYVAFVVDVFSHMIVGWRVWNSLKTYLVLDTLGPAPAIGVVAAEWISYVYRPGTRTGACAQQPVRVHGDWHTRGHTAQPYERVLVVGVSPDVNQRCAFEGFFATVLREGGTVAITSCHAMTTHALLTRENIEKAVAAHHIQAVLATILVATHVETREGGTEESRGDAYYKATDIDYATGWYAGGYGAYGVPVVYGKFETAPPITTIEGDIQLATRVFDARDATLVYELTTSGRGLESRISALAEMTDPMAGKLRKDGVVR